MTKRDVNGKMYSLVKVHKSNHQVRTVVSMIGTAEYQLAKFLYAIIKPYILQTYCICSNSGSYKHLSICYQSNAIILYSMPAKRAFTLLQVFQSGHM